MKQEANPPKIEELENLVIEQFQDKRRRPSRFSNYQITKFPNTKLLYAL